MGKAEQKRRWKRRYPEKVRAGRQRYLDNRIRKEIKANPDAINLLNEKLVREFHTLTRILYDEILPKHCELCSSREDLQIHHLRYVFPIVKEDLIRLCRKCHVLEHQKIHPLKKWERG
ncbi:MAG: hypothetical protein PHS30_10285 [Bacteroidales bacterium]|nr:hypothetical protein [Bacteroidales bacterium]